MTTVNVVHVPVKYEGKELKAPFLLFTGWTVEERRAYARDLRTIRAAWENSQRPLCYIAGDLSVDGKISDKSAVTLMTMFDDDQIGGYGFLTTYVSSVTGLHIRDCKDFRGKWLDMQIGMVDVPDMGF